MGEEQIEVIPKETVEIPEIRTSRQAMSLLWSAMSFFLINYKKTTLIVMALIVFMAVQFSRNFQEVQTIAKLIGM